MTQHRKLIEIQRWFDQHHGGGLVLPDGWFGRPFDSEHELTGLDQSGDDIVMTLDRNLTLTLGGLKAVVASKEALVMESCDRIRIEWDTYDEPSQRKVTDYASGGSVRIIPFPV